MMKHVYTEPTEINFSKLEERIMQINDPYLGNYNDIRELLYKLITEKKPTLIMATGGSKVIAYYLQLILERIGTSGIISEVIEPRDYYYKANREMFSNLVVISASGNTNGVKEALLDFPGNKYLITEKRKDDINQVIFWGNDLYDKEKSLISLATTLGPISLLLDSVDSLNKLSSMEIIKTNDKIKELLSRSRDKVYNLNDNYKDASLIQIMSGYETKTSANVLESNLTEVGLAAPVIHDKGSFCHGRNNLLFQYPNSKMIYLTHGLKELDKVLIDSINSEYGNITIFDTDDLQDNIFWKEYYLILQMIFLSKKIAEDKNIDITQPDYNPNIVKRLYLFKGEM